QIQRVSKEYQYNIGTSTNILITHIRTYWKMCTNCKCGSACQCGANCACVKNTSNTTNTTQQQSTNTQNETSPCGV
ncbi:35311_t:CDS:1, partial [Gigaspora margarita]